MFNDKYEQWNCWTTVQRQENTADNEPVKYFSDNGINNSFLYYTAFLQFANRCI